MPRHLPGLGVAPQEPPRATVGGVPVLLGGVGVAETGVLVDVLSRSAVGRHERGDGEVSLVVGFLLSLLSAGLARRTEERHSERFGLVRGLERRVVVVLLVGNETLYGVRFIRHRKKV